MREAAGNIWKLAEPLDYIVIATSIGWRRDGAAVMKQGLARWAAERWSTLEEDYGEECEKHRAATPVLVHRPRGLNTRNLILFPVRPLDVETPQLSWRKPVDILLIKRSLRQLEELLPQLLPGREVFIPDVGCGNRQLPIAVVRPLIATQFKEYHQIVHVRSR